MMKRKLIQYLHIAYNRIKTVTNNHFSYSSESSKNKISDKNDFIKEAFLEGKKN